MFGVYGFRLVWEDYGLGLRGPMRDLGESLGSRVYIEGCQDYVIFLGSHFNQEGKIVLTTHPT